MTTAASQQSARALDEPDYNSPIFIQQQYAKNVRDGKFGAALMNAGQLARYFRGEMSSRNSWVEKFFGVLRRGKVSAATLLIQFSRFWDLPEFRTPESLIDAGKQLTDHRKYLPNEVLPFVAQLLLQGLAGISERQVLTEKRIAAEQSLQTLLRAGVKVPQTASVSVPPLEDLEVAVRQSIFSTQATIRLLVYRQQREHKDSLRRIVVFEQISGEITPRLVSHVFSRCWPREVKIDLRNLQTVFAIRLFRDIKQSKVEPYIVNDPTSSSAFFVPTYLEHITKETGYALVPSWIDAALCFVKGGGVTFPTERKIREIYG